MKTIKLMPDYQCYPLWDMTPGEYGDLDPMTLPIPELLQSQLMDWARVLDLELMLVPRKHVPAVEYMIRSDGSDPIEELPPAYGPLPDEI